MGDAGEGSAQHPNLKVGQSKLVRLAALDLGKVIEDGCEVTLVGGKRVFGVFPGHSSQKELLDCLE